jgi:hypothetical protein
MAATSKLIGPDYGRLRTTNVNSKTQTSNPALFQTVNGLIDGVKRFQEFTTANFTNLTGTVSSSLNSVSAALTAITEQIIIIRELLELYALEVINPIPIDTSTAPVTIDVGDLPNGFNLIKDVTGNASSNNITLTGTIEGVTDPIINVDYGMLHIFVLDGAYYNWAS